MDLHEKSNFDAHETSETVHTEMMHMCKTRKVKTFKNHSIFTHIN